MRIALLAPPYLPVPPPGYGGTELIVYHVAEELVIKGHDVTLFATGDSKTSAKLVSTYTKSIGNSGEIKSKPLLPLLQYIDCFSRASEFDLIHNNAQYYAMFLADLVKTPAVHTIHGSFTEGEVPEEKRTTLRRFKHHHFVSISDNQASALPELNWAGTVYNGIDISKYPYIDRQGDYLLWIGRVTEKKGAAEAIEVAKRSGVKLKMAGVVDPIDKSYWLEKVKPFVDSGEVEFIGEMGPEDKAKLYGGALATLYPISWHEPFGLVMAESMATGTPVIATRWGSVPEVVEDGVTGYVIENQEPRTKNLELMQNQEPRTKNLELMQNQEPRTKNLELMQNQEPRTKNLELQIRERGIERMVAAVKKIGEIKRADCRKRVEEKFTVEKMVEGYEGIYEKVVKVE